MTLPKPDYSLDSYEARARYIQEHFSELVDLCRSAAFLSGVTVPSAVAVIPDVIQHSLDRLHSHYSEERGSVTNFVFKVATNRTRELARLDGEYREHYRLYERPDRATGDMDIDGGRAELSFHNGVGSDDHETPLIEAGFSQVEDRDLVERMMGKLTPREAELVSLLAQGYRTMEAGQAMGIQRARLFELKRSIRQKFKEAVSG